jgi:hypothetical protein
VIFGGEIGGERDRITRRFIEFAQNKTAVKTGGRYA